MSYLVQDLYHVTDDYKNFTLNWNGFKYNLTGGQFEAISPVDRQLNRVDSSVGDYPSFKTIYQKYSKDGEGIEEVFKDL